MKSYTFILGLIIIVLFQSSSCKEEKNEDYPLPAATTSGKNTMGFLLNGSPWVAKSNDFKISPTDAYWNGDELFIKGVNVNISELGMFLKNVKVGVYEIHDTNTFKYRSFPSNTIYNIDTTSDLNYLEITRFDKKIISGKFNFIFKASNQPDVTLTSGRFDIEID